MELALAPELTDVTAVTGCDLLPGTCACHKATCCQHSFIRQEASVSSLQVSLSYISYGLHGHYKTLLFCSVLLFYFLISIFVMNLGEYVSVCVHVRVDSVDISYITKDQ